MNSLDSRRICRNLWVLVPVGVWVPVSGFPVQGDRKPGRRSRSVMEVSVYGWIVVEAGGRWTVVPSAGGGEGHVDLPSARNVFEGPK